MGLTSYQIKQIKEELDNCTNPLFFFHDDPDGLCSFLLLYRHIREGHGVVIKSIPKVDEKFLRKVEEYQPDKVFILDLAVVEQEFIDKVKVPIIWIDHHEPLERNKVKYFNPRIRDPKDNVPATYMCYQITKKNLWIAMAGCIGDWFVPDFIDDFVKKYPSLAKKVKNPPELLFNSEIGRLSRVLAFILKGKTGDVMKCVKILTRLETPYEVLEQSSPRGKYLYKKYETMGKIYDKLLKGAIERVSNDKLLVFTYSEKEMSFTGDLANELLYRYPKKVIIIGRKKADEVRMSLRASKIILRDVLEKALQQVQGYGGGHEHACGACVKQDDFDRFLEIIRREI